MTKKEKVDLTGNVFGRLTALRPGQKRGIYYFWLCRCTCGNTLEVRGSALRHGEAQSCGCLRKENSIAAIATHRKSKSGVYSSWNSMMQRCHNHTHDQYPRYGGSGIVVCEQWHNFENFFRDMGDRPAGMTIDRIDGEKNYEPGNCQWASKKEQANNRKNNKPIAFNGRSMNAREWGKETGIPWQTIDGRLRRGWSVERALTPK